MDFGFEFLIPPVLQSVVHLAVTATCLVTVASVIDRFNRSGQQKRRIWRAAMVGLLIVALMELTGVNAAIVGKAWLQGGQTSERAGIVDASELLSDRNPAGIGEQLLSESWDFKRTDQQLPGGWLEDPKVNLLALRADQATEREPREAAPTGDRWVTTTPPHEPIFHWHEATVNRVVAVLWLMGCLIVVFQRVVLSVRLAMLWRALGPITDLALGQRIDALAKRLVLRRRFVVRQSARAATPFTFGFVRPTLVLPVAFSTCYGVRQQQAILAHELTHLKGCDSLWQSLSSAVTAFFWWHPLVWCASNRMRLAMEFAADEAAAILPSGASELAECLVAMGQRITGGHGYGFGMAGAGFRSVLGQRVERLLVLSRSSRRRPHRWRRARGVFMGEISIVLVFVSCALLTAWATPIRNSFSMEGEDQMQILEQGWRGSLAMALIGGLLAPAALPAQDAQFLDVADGFESTKGFQVDAPAADAVEPRDGREGGQREERAQRRRLQQRRMSELDFDKSFGEDVDERSRARQVRRALELALRELDQRLEKGGHPGSPDSAASEDVDNVLANLRRKIEELQARRVGFASGNGHQANSFRMDSHQDQRRRAHFSAAIANLLAAGLKDQARELEKRGVDSPHQHRRQPAPGNHDFPHPEHAHADHQHDEGIHFDPRRDADLHTFDDVRRDRKERSMAGHGGSFRRQSSPSEVAELRSQVEVLRAEVREMTKIIRKFAARNPEREQ